MIMLKWLSEQRLPKLFQTKKKASMNNPDYEKAKELGLTKIDRWGTGKSHHPMSERLMDFLSKHDFEDYSDFFCWETGGDGDNGEILMFEMDAFFEMLDATKEKKS